MAPFRLFSGLALTLLLVGMCSSQTVRLEPPAIPPSYETALHHAARTGDITLIQSQLAYGAEPNQRSQDGCKPLLDSASTGQLGAVRALLSGGAGTDITSFFGRTALIESADVRERLGTVPETDFWPFSGRYGLCPPFEKGTAIAARSKRLTNWHKPYQYTLNSGQTLGVGTNWTFAAPSSGNGAVHPTSGDTYTVSYTTGGTNFSQLGHL